MHGHPERGLSFRSLSPLLKYTTHHLTVLTFTVWSPWTFSKHWWVSMGAIFSTSRNWVPHLYALECQTPFCQTAPLLPSVTWQQHVIEYWWEGSTSTAIPPTFAFDFVGQHHKIGHITFRSALIIHAQWNTKHSAKMAANPFTSLITYLSGEIWTSHLQSKMHYFPWQLVQC